jgi:hypothetical protein
MLRWGSTELLQLHPFWMGELAEDQLVVGESWAGILPLLRLSVHQTRLLVRHLELQHGAKYTFETRYLMISDQDYLHLPFEQIIIAIEQLA